MGLSRARMLELLKEAEVWAKDQQAWTRVDGTVHGRVLSFNLGFYITQVHTRPYRIQHPLWQPMTPEQAHVRHWGRVRCVLFPPGHPTVEIEEAVRLALAALKDPSKGEDVE
jgi:hypothetical protein